MTASEFKDIFDVFSSLSDAKVNTFIGFAEARIDADVFGDLYDQALAYLTAHLLAVSSQAEAFAAGGVGPVTSQTVGPLSRSFAAASGYVKTSSPSDYSMTPYGQHFLTLLNMVLPGPMVA